MRYKILADLIMILHFAWVLFMLWGFVLTLYSVIRLYVFRSMSAYCRHFMDRWIFRTVHLGGIAFVALLAALGKYCPLSILEYNIRLRYDPALTYPGSFLVNWIEKLVYPSVPPLVIIIPTIFFALFTLLAYLLHPPKKLNNFFNRADNSD